jgi:hypothetical protein
MVLLAGVVLAVLAGAAAAVAAPSDEGRPSWQDDGAQRLTATVTAVDGHDVILDELLSYDPVRPVIGTLVVEVGDPGTARSGDTVDIDVTRQDGRWTAPELTLLVPD